MDIEQMRIRMGEMAAEIERLKSIIDEANAQEPAVTVVEWNAGGSGSFKEAQGIHRLDGGTKLYARPIPAQQSPVIPNGVYENKCSCGSFFFGVKNQPFCAKCYDDKLRSQQSPAVAISKTENTTRITEQDTDGLLPLRPIDHPDCQVMLWSEQELRAIKGYTKRCIAALPQRVTEQDAVVKAWKDAIETLSKGSENGVHPDDVAVNRFSEAMKIKLAKSRDKGRGGWENPALCKVIDLASMLIDHLPKGDPVDVANFAMMLFFREGGNTALSDAGRALLNKLNDKPNAFRYYFDKSKPK